MGLLRLIVRALFSSPRPPTRRVMHEKLRVDGHSDPGSRAASGLRAKDKTAKWALVNLCKGQTVHAVLEGAMSYDRTVATCYLPDGRDLSAEMVKLGLAIDWPKFSGGKYRQFEVPGIRRKLWRCDARQKGRMPPPVR